MTTDVDVCNLALARLGDARISAIDTTTAQGTYCGLFYSQTLEELQTDYEWQFCRKIATLTATAAPAMGYSAAYTLPADYLRLLRVNDVNMEENFGRFEIVGSTLHTSITAPVRIDYISSVTTVTSFPALFTELLSIKLAANLAMPLTGSKELFTQLAELYAATLQKPAFQTLVANTQTPRTSNAIATSSDIVRLAVLKLGTTESLTTRQAALFGHSIYDATRDEVLEEFDWAFARLLASISADGTNPAFGYARRYAVPSGGRRILRVNEIDHTENFGRWEVVAGFIHSDETTPIRVEYTGTPTDVTKYPAVFVELLAIRLALKLAQAFSVADRLDVFAKEIEFLFAKTAFINATLTSAKVRSSSAVSSQADIVRLAILKTGTADGYKPSGQAAMLGNSFFDQARNELLSEFDWSFARTSASITADAVNPVTGYAKRYALPAGALTVLRVNEVDASENFSVWEVVGGFIHTEAASPILVEFTTTITDITKFPAIFIDLLVNKIAMRLAMTTGDAGRMEILAKETEFIFQKPGFSKAIEKIAPIRPSVALSATEICKQAVMRLGTTDSLSQTGGHPALFAHSFYDHTLEELLAELPWAFAKKQVSITDNATPPTQGYSKRYATPADFLQLIRVNQFDTTENFGQWEIVGGFIHTDLGSPIIIDYTANITDVTQFPALFVEALIARIAAKIALPLTAKPEIATALTQAAAETLTRPTIQILVEKSAKPRATSSVNSVSEICRQAILRVGSADIFKPFGEPMVLATSFFDQSRNELLAEFNWSFARASAQVSANATDPIVGYAKRYAIPAGSLAILRVNEVDQSENFGAWELFGEFIHSDYATPIKVEYTQTVTDVTKFPPVFIDLLVNKIASRLAMTTGDGDRVAVLSKENEFHYAKPAFAKAIESNTPARAAASISVQEICRMAILRVGTNKQFGPSSQAQALAESLYPQVRDALLLAHPWTWAIKATTLTADTLAPEFKWDNRFALPSDCLRVTRVDDTLAESNEEDWEMAGDHLLTDATSTAPNWTTGRTYAIGNAVTQSGTTYRCLAAHTAGTFATDLAASRWAAFTGDVLCIEYVARITDPAKFDSLFIDLLTASLAAKLATPLLGDDQKTRLLTTEVESLLRNPAMRRDSTERRSRVRPAWLNSRLVAQRSVGGIP